MSPTQILEHIYDITQIAVLGKASPLDWFISPEPPIGPSMGQLVHASKCHLYRI